MKVVDIVEVITNKMPDFPVIKAIELAIELDKKIIRLPYTKVELVEPGDVDARD